MPKPKTTPAPTVKTAPVLLQPEAVDAVRRYIAMRAKREPGLRLPLRTAVNVLLLDACARELESADA